MRSRGTATVVLAALIIIAALIGSASAHADVPGPGDFSPAIWSDKPDYSPGEHVVLSGANWQPGETVHVTVNDDAGSTWNRAVDVTADDAGNITDGFDLPSWFVAQYHVRAETASGSVATYDFTDGNVKFGIAPTNDTAQFVETLYTAATNCSGAVKAGYPKTLNGSAGDNVGLGSSESLRIDAAATNDQLRTFSAWSSTDSPASQFTVITGTGGKSICIPGNQSGSQNYRATYTANTPPIAVADNYSVNEDATLSPAAAAGVLANDTDADNNTLTAVLVSGPSHGSLTLNSNGSFTYTPAANYNGSDSFTYKGNDGIADSNTVTVSLAVASVNDAPAGTNKTVTTNEDTDYVFTTGDFGFSDPNDSPPNTLLAVKITTLPANGSVTDNSVAVSAGVVIPVADITGGKLKFSPAANGNGSPYTTFTFQVEDNGGTANGGADLDGSPNTITVNVTSVNDAPAGTTGSATINEDGFYTFAAGDFGFSDPNDPPANAFASVTITTLPAKGSLKKGASAVTAGQVIPVAEIPNLTFTPAADANGSPYASFTFQVIDDGGTANGGVDTDQSPNTFTINVRSINDAPAGADKTVSTNEDTDYTFTSGDFRFTDPKDSPPNTLLAVKITTTATPSTLKDNGTAVTDGQLIPVADITGGKLKFSPAANANGSAYAAFTFQVQDNGATANGGVDLDPSANTITIDVTPVNNRPTAAASPTSLTMNEDAGAQTVSLSGNDVETGAADLTFTITHAPAHGTLKHGTYTLATNDTFTGSPQDVTYKPDADYNGSDDFKFTVTDRGDPDNCGTPGAFCDAKSTSTEVTVPITVNSVNDAPAGADKTVTTNEDTDYTLTTADFGFSDTNDSPPNTLVAVKITASVTHGTLKNDGTDVTDGQLIAVADINAGKLKFHPADNANGTGYASFTFQVQDKGSTANGGVDLDPSANTITVDVTSVNDAPSGADNTVTTDEDTAYTFAAVDFVFTDPHDSPADAFQTVKVKTLPSAGVLKDDGADVTAGQFVSVDDITAGKLKFHPAADANGSGYASFTFQVQDDGGITNGGVDLDPSANTITVDVTAVNDAPAGADATVMTAEDHDYVVQRADFGFTDPNDTPANALAGAIITTTPTHGTLTDDGTTVTANTEISAAHIAAGKLIFHPVTDKNGSPYAAFAFQVRDNGTTTNGGQDTDQTANTLTINVTPVNDQPTASASLNPLTIDEDSGAHTVSLSGNDVETGAINLTFTVTAIPAHGTLKHGTDAVAANDTFSGSPQNVSYEPDADYHGPDSFKFTVTDRGDPDSCGTPGGLCDAALTSSEATAAITVNSVNDAPDGADNTVVTSEDTAYTFDASDFGFTDTHDHPADELAAVKIKSVPNHGRLTNDGVTVHDLDEIPVGDINAGKLKFHPAANANGTGYATFTLQVRDNGGTGNGGIDLDPSANTITVDVTSVNDAPSGADNTVTTLEDHAHTFAASDFGFADPDDAPSPNRLAAVKITTLPSAGALKNDGADVTAGQFVTVADINAGHLKFDPAANENGAGYASFTFQVQDDGGTANSGVDLDQSANTITVDVTSVNDAPSGADNTVTTEEDTAYPLTSSDFAFSDPNDSPANAFAAVVISTLPANGTLTNDGNPIHTGDEVSVTDINNHKLVFTPEHNANGAGYDSFTFQVRDDGGTDHGGQDTDQTANAITIDVTPVNDAPDGTDNTITTDEDVAYKLQTVDFGFTDANDAPNANDLASVVITTAPSHGSLTDNGSTVADGHQISAADIVAGKLKFHPAANANGAGYGSLTFQVRDGGGTAHNGVDLDPVPNTITFDVTPVNDQPTAAASPDSLSIDEDSGPHPVSLSGSDVETGAANLTFTITNAPAHGTLKHGSHTLADTDTFIGSPQDVSYEPDANFNGDDNFKFTVTDRGDPDNCGTAGPFCADTAGSDEINVPITVASVNDAPAGSDNTVTTLEDHAHTFAASEFEFSDTNDDPANALAAVVITTLPANGTLTNHGHAITAGDEVSAADIADHKLVFTPEGNASGAGYDHFTFQVRDNGGTDNGGQDTDQTANAITIDVTPVNDEPAGGTPTVQTTEDHDYVVQTADFGFTDPNDSPANALAEVVITTTPTHGTLSDDGVTVAAGAAVSAAHITAGKLVFHPVANAYGSPYATFTVQVRDNGGTTNGGQDTDQSPNQFTINVTPVNDAPSGTDNSVTTNEDTSRAFAAADFGFSDATDAPDANSLAAVKIATLATHGTLTNDGLPVTAGQSIPVADINANKLEFTPATNANGSGYATFTFQVQDNGGAADGGVDLDPSPNAITVNVKPINDKPTATASPSPLTLDEDGSAAVSLSATDVEATNASDMTFKITTAPTHGTLKQGATTLTGGSTVIPSSNVTYTPDPDYNGSDSLRFSVTDRGDPDNCGTVGTYCDGALSDELTVPITVNPVNDAPVLHTAGTPTLSDIVANDTHSGGTSIDDLITRGGTGYITDVDAGAVQGIAVTGADTSTGSWQYSTDGGSNWNDLGSVSGTNARLLERSAATKLRFRPSLDYNGSDPTITFRAWDRTAGTNGGTANPSPNGGITAFSSDTDTAGITVQKRLVNVSESCVPATVVVGQSTTCTTTVTDTESNGTQSNPGGSVNVANTVGTGNVGASPCTLSGVSGSSDTSKCDVTYTPGNAGATTHTIKGTYGGASPHKGGDASANVSVNKRATQSAVVCGNPVAMNNSVMCTVTVTDVETNGTKSGPSGSVTFSKSAGADGTFSNGGTCTLGTPGSDKASCNITYTSPDVGVDAISATYNGSNIHVTSSSGTSSALAVTYDPSAGFVTGGGTIASPAGAYTANPSLTGQANFGFVSKYLKGQSTPTGQTEFQFQTAGFNFHSELYDWLVVAGSKAQYKGTGTVNGVSGFSFMITAVDGSPDKFRMKVWNTATSAVVYDNKLGSPDTFDATTTADTQSISGGSVVIHK